MQAGKLSTRLRLSAGISLIVALGAAAPVDTSISPVLPQPSISPSVAVVKSLSISTASFQAAPVPDQDVDAPADRSKPDTTISPKLLSPKSLFQGDGYSYASSEQTTLDNRRAAAPGLGLSVPVQ